MILCLRLFSISLLFLFFYFFPFFDVNNPACPIDFSHIFNKILRQRPILNF